MRTEAEWAALCCASETNRPHEARYVLWVIRNRVLSPKFPNSVREVVLQDKQFSFFNHMNRLVEAVIFHDALADYPGKSFDSMIPAARAILAAGLWEAPFGPDVLHYYSPVSMAPKGSVPPWASKARWLFTPSGVEPSRFVFCAGVP